MSDWWGSTAADDQWLQRPSGVGGMPGLQGAPSQGVTLNTPPPLPAPPAPYPGLPLMSAQPPAYAGPPMSANPMPPPAAAPVTPPMNAVDRDTLIKTINGEAGGEPEAGQSAVAHVILNRLAAGGYGNSITDIVKAPVPDPRDAARGYHEFSMWNPPGKEGNKGGQLDPNSDVYAKIGDVVDRAYYGGSPDPTGGATHYYAGAPPKQWSRDWLNSQPKVRVGSQIFVGGAEGPGRKPMVVGALGDS